MGVEEDTIELLSSEGEQSDSHREAQLPKKGAFAGSAGPICPNIYSKSCRCKKDSPFCLAGLIPGPTGFRKKGLWQKDAKALIGGAQDPSENKRADEKTPSGLNNLGNTCYVNGALQCLFMTRAFRQGLYSVEPAVSKDEVIAHIRNLFAAMQMSTQASADPSAFALSLKLDNAVQQDGQEFFKLLLSHLEAKFRASSSNNLKTLVPRLFRGSYVFRTTCMSCFQPSESSSRETYFYELDVQVKGFTTLEDSLKAMQNAELLEGSNQYFCSHCNRKVDATRQLCLKSLPPYLCLSLQRFVFDLKKCTKVKASDKMSFPLTLEPESWVSEQAGPVLGAPQYELAAILIHKGPSAFHGHYVAHIKEEASGKWWRCDDETVTALQKGPMECIADLGVAPEKKFEKKSEKKGAGRGARGKRPRESSEDLAPGDSNKARLESNAAASTSERILAANAYMLLYRPKTARRDAESQIEVDLPQNLAAIVEASNQKFLHECKHFQEQFDKLMQQLKDRRIRVREIAELAPLNAESQEFRYVSGKWLRKWADAVEPLAADNSDIFCTHMKLHPDKLKDAKKISVAAWQRIVAGDGCSGPEILPQDVCEACLSVSLKANESKAASLEARHEILAQLEAADEKGSEPSGSFFVSKTWLTGWKKRAAKVMSLTSPTESIACPHGGLLPEAAGMKAKRVCIPLTAWNYFKEAWAEAKAEHWQQAKRKAQEAKDASFAKRVAQEPESGVAILDDGWEKVPEEFLKPEASQPTDNGHLANGDATEARPDHRDDSAMSNDGKLLGLQSHVP